MFQVGAGSVPAAGLLPIVQGDSLVPHALGFLGPSLVSLHVPGAIPFQAGGIRAVSRRGTELSVQETQECAVGFPLLASMHGWLPALTTSSALCKQDFATTHDILLKNQTTNTFFS